VNWNNRNWTFLLSLLLLSAFGCESERKETPTKGYVKVVVSEDVAPLIGLEQRKFMELYPQARVEVAVASAREAITRLFNDTISLIVSSRPLNTEERDIALRTKLVYAGYKMAIDAVAIIVNAENPVTELRTTALDSVLTGACTLWSEVGGSSGPIEICLPSPNSANFELLRTKLLMGKSFATPGRVVSSSPEMLQAVSERANTVGMVGLNWLSEKKENVRVLALMDPLAPDSLNIKGEYFVPHQAHVYRGYYPLTREVYLYSKADNYGVAAGFLSFITSGPGQKIVLNSGLVPATMPVRLVELTNKGIPQ
jgi:phosphate transport system substrate-binding protein